MNAKRSFVAAFFLFLTAYSRPALLLAQQHIPTAKLSEAEIEQVREASIFPDMRIELYTKFGEDRAKKVKVLSGRPRSAQRVLNLDNTLQDLTALMDELGSNLDQYSDRHSDIRRSLKALNEATPKWLGILRTLAGESGFDLARKEAIEAGEELSDQAIRLLKEQDEYFATHKDEKDQERNDDSPKEHSTSDQPAKPQL